MKHYFIFTNNKFYKQFELNSLYEMPLKSIQNDKIIIYNRADKNYCFIPLAYGIVVNKETHPEYFI